MSLPTVSKVLNARAGVFSETRAKVTRILQAHGYAIRKASSNPKLLELVFPELESVCMLPIIHGVAKVANANGLGVILTESGTREGPEVGWVEGVMERRPAGVLLVFSGLPLECGQHLESCSIPFVIIDPDGNPAPDIPSVGSANGAGGLMATRHLIGLGHQRIAAISGPQTMMSSLARIDGYSSCLSSVGIPIDYSLIRFGDMHVDGGRAQALELVQMTERPSAIFAGSDLQALGVLGVASELRLSVPEDLSVIGYGDFPTARWSSPPLTTVHQPLTEMAEEAARMVLCLRKGEELQNPRLDLAPSLVVRGSTAPVLVGPT